MGGTCAHASTPCQSHNVCGKERHICGCWYRPYCGRRTWPRDYFEFCGVLLHPVRLLAGAISLLFSSCSKKYKLEPQYWFIVTFTCRLCRVYRWHASVLLLQSTEMNCLLVEVSQTTLKILYLLIIWEGELILNFDFFYNLFTLIHTGLD